MALLGTSTFVITIRVQLRSARELNFQDVSAVGAATAQAVKNLVPGVVVTGQQTGLQKL